MEIEAIVKLIIGILLGLETIGFFVSYKFNLLPKFNPYFYLLTILSMIGFFVYLSIDSSLFVAENHFTTYLILFGVVTIIEGIGCLILFFIKKNDIEKEEPIEVTENVETVEIEEFEEIEEIEEEKNS